MKSQKKKSWRAKASNHTEHLWKNPKHNPLHFERAYLAHFPLDCKYLTYLDMLGGGLQNCFNFQKEQTMDKRAIMIQYC